MVLPFLQILSVQKEQKELQPEQIDTTQIQKNKNTKIQ